MVEFIYGNTPKNLHLESHQFVKHDPCKNNLSIYSVPLNVVFVMLSLTIWKFKFLPEIIHWLRIVYSDKNLDKPGFSKNDSGKD